MPTRHNHAFRSGTVSSDDPSAWVANYPSTFYARTLAQEHTMQIRLKADPWEPAGGYSTMGDGEAHIDAGTVRAPNSSYGFARTHEETLGLLLNTAPSP